MYGLESESEMYIIPLSGVLMVNVLSSWVTLCVPGVCLPGMLSMYEMEYEMLKGLYLSGVWYWEEDYGGGEWGVRRMSLGELMGIV